MKKPKISQIKRTNNFAAEGPSLSRSVDLLSNAVFHGVIFLIIAIAFFVMTFPTEKNAGFAVATLILSTLFGFLMFKLQFRGTNTVVLQSDEFREALIKYLKKLDFITHYDNKQFTAAQYTKLGNYINDDFYAIYLENSVLLFCISYRPFPFSLMRSRRIIKEVLNEVSVANKPL